MGAILQTMLLKSIFCSEQFKTAIDFFLNFVTKSKKK